ncbi:hypothetical protein P153DRAFT_363701 [Dothidotthia symphoricarpi CBS 119687]|uniref:Uncharacterized protein n=1 Tax=Dothidotthia symphoricarpi CBS 119687 TaxID=1392245 RepID=A0A6A6APR3_9PLEO|nr:uncharacterized protein P153DRAFT_363701 [Dothidotthia symphoricarpi CBS 119687]KAF2133526.1 hypothetical protein P153DRAFT_363701 [Dothidotthia symphoricarpi CBS 119687]
MEPTFHGSTSDTANQNHYMADSTQFKMVSSTQLNMASVGALRPTVALPLPRKREITGLLLLALIFPYLAIYLDGGSAAVVICNILLVLTFWPIGIIHGLVYICRGRQHRSMSRPMRTSLWIKNEPEKQPFQDAYRESKPENAFSNQGQEAEPVKDQSIPTRKTITLGLPEYEYPLPRKQENPFRDQFV